MKLLLYILITYLKLYVKTIELVKTEYKGVTVNITINRIRFSDYE